MYSAKDAYRDSQKVRQASQNFLSYYWTDQDERQYKRVIKKIMRAAKKGKQEITVSSINFNVQKKLEDDGYKVDWCETISENIYFVVRWACDKVITDAESRKLFGR